MAGIGVQAVQDDILTYYNRLPSGGADLIISNPPYLTAEEMAHLMPETAREPAMALDGGAVVTVQGNTCPRGDAYARKEVTAPTRIVTTTVRVTGGTLPAVSCKTRSDIPKEKIFDVVRALKSVVVPAPVHIGQILLPDAAGTGVDVVATKDVAEV